MAVNIAIPTALRAYVGGQSSVDIEGATVDEALTNLTATHEGLAKHLRDGSGKLPQLRQRLPQRRGHPVPHGEGRHGAQGRGPAHHRAVHRRGPVMSGAGTEGLPELDSWDIARYSRHLILDEVGMEGQRRLKGGSVLCVGTGGLGSPLLMYLAAAGVGRIGIVDFDTVDESNLQRQIIHGTSTVGKPKTESAKQRILDINPRCQIDIYETALVSDNGPRDHGALRRGGGRDGQLPDPLPGQRRLRAARQAQRLRLDLQVRGPGDGVQLQGAGRTTGTCTRSRPRRGWCPPARRAGSSACCRASSAASRPTRPSRSCSTRGRRCPGGCCCSTRCG